MASLRSTIDILSRFRGVPNNAWLEDVISNLEFRFGVKPNTENVVSFEQNNLLKGLEFLGELIDCAINHQPIDLQYRTYAGNETKSIVHPYHLKQFNNRWFLIGLQEGTNENYITNKALDRIVKFSRANVPFIPNNNIDFNEYFKDVLGVTIPSPEVKIENIILKFDEDRFPYVVTKPIHHSQIILSKDDRTVQISVRPNPELEAHILFYGDQVEVIKPQWLRERIIEKIKNNLNKYASMQIDCTERQLIAFKNVNRKL